MNKYNLDKLVSVRLHDKHPSVWYEFRKEKTLLGFVIQKEGLYTTIFSNGPIADEKTKNLFVIDGKVYEKPECVLCFQDQTRMNIIFETLQEAKDKQAELTAGRNWITI